MLSIVILDKYPVMRLGIADFFKTHLQHATITEAETDACFSRSGPMEHPDIVILGINDNSENKDLSILLELKSHFPKSQIIIYDEIKFRFQNLPYLEYGISGYLLKQNDPAELLRCVGIVASGKRYICNQVLQDLFENFLLRERDSKPGTFNLS